MAIKIFTIFFPNFLWVIRSDGYSLAISFLVNMNIFAVVAILDD